MGASVGGAVGAAVGPKVGLDVGAEVGAFVGASDGAAVGLDVGTEVGASVGATGALVGTAVTCATIPKTPASPRDVFILVLSCCRASIIWSEFIGAESLLKEKEISTFASPALSLLTWRFLLTSMELTLHEAQDCSLSFTSRNNFSILSF